MDDKDKLKDLDWLDAHLPRGYMSPSQLSMYRKCPRQYEYAYVKQLKRPPGISQLRGSAVHKAVEMTHLETMATGAPLGIDAGAAVASDYLDKREEELESEEKSLVGEAKDTAIRMYKVYHREAVPKIRPVRVEHTFYWDLDVCGVPVLGVIDLVDSVEDTDMSLENDPENPGRVEVVSDLKTVQKMWPESKIENEPQLTFYAIAENTDRVRIDFLMAQKTGTKYKAVTSRRNATAKKILLEDVQEVTQCIKKGVFPRCDPTAWNCSPTWCGYYHLCRK